MDPHVQRWHPAAPATSPSQNRYDDGGSVGDDDAHPDFATAIDSLLRRTDAIVAVRHAAEVDTGTLKQILAMFARKLQLQENTIEKQGDDIVELRTEIGRLRAAGDATKAATADVPRLAREIQELRGAAQRQQQHIASLEEENERLRLDLADAMASMSRAPPPPSQAQTVADTSLSSGRLNASAVTVSTPEPRRGPFDGARASALRHAAHADGESNRHVHYSEHDSSHLDAARSAAHAPFDSDFPEPQQRANASVAIGAPPPAAATATPQRRPGAAAASWRSGIQHASGASPGAVSAVSATSHGTTSHSSSRAARPLAGIDLTDTIGGAKITAVKPGGPAHTAGLRVGETIIRFNGKEVRDKHDVMAQLQRCVPGQCVDIAHRMEGHAVVTTKLYLGAATVPHRATLS